MYGNQKIRKGERIYEHENENANAKYLALREFKGGFKVRTLKVKSISVMLIFSMMLAMFMPLFPVKVYAESDTRTQITRINLHATSGTTVAEYGATITQPVVEIVSSDPTGAVSYLSLNGIANWFKNGEYVAPGNTFGEGNYYLQISINLSGTGQGLYKWADDTKIMYLDGTRLSRSGVGDSHLINRLYFNLESPSGTIPTITTSSLSAGNIGDEYSATLTATGTKPITWSLKSGSSLPSGLNLTSNGVISGTPTVSGDYNFTVVATNSAGSVEKNLSLKIKNLQKITRINVHATSGTIVAEYGATITQPIVELVSSEPSGAFEYLSLGGSGYYANWYKDGEYVAPGNTFGEGEYYLQISINLSGTGQGLYKWADDTKIMYLDGTRLSSSGVGDSHLINELEYTVSSTATTHKVTFNSNGGSAVAQQDVVHGGTITEPTNPTKNGYAFAGWYADSELTIPFDFSTAINNNTRLYAKWNVAHNVTFNLDGGTWTDTGTNPQVVNDGETAIRPTNPTKSGHVFAGWYADSACTTPFSFLTAITSNKTIYAKWNIITNSVNAILSPTPSVGLTIGDLTLTSGDSSKYSVSEVYWKLNDSGSYLASTTPIEAGQTYTLYLTYYPETGYTIPDGATYTVNGIPNNWSGFEADSNRKISFTIPAVTTYTVTFDSAGGSAVTAQTIEAGQKATKPADPTKANYAFAGWYSDSGLTQAFDFNTPITGDTTIYAKWDVVITAANATVTVPVAGEHPDFNPISGDSSRYTVAFETWYLYESPYPVLDANSVFEHGKYYSLRISFTPNAGYQFDSNTVFTVNGKATACFGGIGDREYSAAAYAATYTVTYDANGGTGSMADATGVSGEYTLLANGFTAPDGKQFKAWSVGGDEKAVGDKITVTANTTVTAIWEAVEYNVTVTGGTASVGAGAPITKATMGTTVTLTAGAAPTGQMFDKWVVNGVVVDDANSATTTFVMPAGEVTATATYKDIPVVTYTVTFDSNGGSAVTAQTIEAGQKATMPADPTKSGYDFKGWTLNGSAYDFNTAVNGDITLVATWEQQQVVPTTYTVSFAANGGTGTMADVTGISGEYTLPANGFTAPEGKQFKTWSVNGSEKAVGDKITVTADTTVTAVWETIPAGHTCDIKPVTKVEPSCTEGGKEAYYKCEGCGKFYEDALGAKEITDLAAWGNIAKNGHTESDWKSDKDNHWKECTVAACGVIIENSKAAHADANNDGKCDTCEYNVGTTTTKPEDTNKPSDDVQSPQTGDNSMMWLWVALLFVSGFGVVATTVYGKRRTARK